MRYSSRRNLAFVRSMAVAVVGALLMAACGTSSSTVDSQAAEAPVDVEVSANMLVADAEPEPPVDLSNVPGVELGLRLTTSGPDFAFESIAAKPTVIWFWGPG